MKIDPKQFVNNSTVEIKYCDSEGYTVPVTLTEKRLNDIYTDMSIESIKLTTPGGLVFELSVL